MPFYFTFIILAAVVLEVGSTDILLPVLTQLQSNYSVSFSHVEMLISLNLLGLGLSSFVYGYISDYFGRRPVYIAGSFLFFLSSVINCFTHDFSILLLFRFLQGIGGGVCATVGLAMLKDAYDDVGYTKALAWLGSILSAAPVLFPLLSGVLLVKTGLQSIFYFIAILSAFTTILIWVALPETHKNKKANNLSVSDFIKQNLTIFKNKLFISYVTISGITYAGIWVYLAIFAVIYVKVFGYKPQTYGLFLIVNVLASSLGAIVQPKLAKNYSAEKILKYSVTLMLASTICLLLTAITFNNIVLISLFVSVYWFNSSIIFANASVLALNQFPNSYGVASAFLLSAELLFGFFAVWIATIFYNSTILPMAVVLLFCSLIVCFLTYINRYLKKIYFSQGTSPV